MADKALGDIYAEVLTKVNRLLGDEVQGNHAIRESITKNVKSIYSWLPKTDSEFDKNKQLHAAAKETLETASAILNAIEHIADPTKYKLPAATGAKSYISQVFSGGHILIEDDVALIDLLNSQMNSKLVARFSSHYRKEKIALFKQQNRQKYLSETELEQAAIADFNKSTPDFSIRAELIFNELTIGEVTDENGKRSTWLQFEGHSHQARTVYQNVLAQLLDNVLQMMNYSIEKFITRISPD